MKRSQAAPPRRGSDSGLGPGPGRLFPSAPVCRRWAARGPQAGRRSPSPRPARLGTRRLTHARAPSPGNPTFSPERDTQGPFRGLQEVVRGGVCKVPEGHQRSAAGPTGWRPASSAGTPCLSCLRDPEGGLQSAPLFSTPRQVWRQIAANPTWSKGNSWMRPLTRVARLGPLTAAADVAAASSRTLTHRRAFIEGSDPQTAASAHSTPDTVSVNTLNRQAGDQH